MSVQFGRWNFNGRPCAPDYLEKVSSMLAPYGPDSKETYSKSGVEILYRAFHTTKESHRETQPYISRSGAVITWDGRLDNRKELIESLQNLVSTNSTDVEIVGAAFDRWNKNCLAKFIGDWSLSVWSPQSTSLLLAKDCIGTRRLYYTIQNDWIACYPATHLTPYQGIHSVPPSSFVSLRRGKHTVAKYWDFDPEKRIYYRM